MNSILFLLLLPIFGVTLFKIIKYQYLYYKVSEKASKRIEHQKEMNEVKMQICEDTLKRIGELHKKRIEMIEQLNGRIEEETKV